MNQSSAATLLDSRIDGFAAATGLRITHAGAGRPVLLLHGGGGPISVQSFAATLADRYHVITPTHPGFNGTERRVDFTSVKQLAQLYADLVAAMAVPDLLVIGFSIGGWIAAELALLQPGGVAGYVLVDAAGIAVQGLEVLDVFALAPGQIYDFSYHQPARYRIDPASMSPAQQVAMRANFVTLRVYGDSHNMQDPDLRLRLAAVTQPVLVVWGESDRVTLPRYGEAYAEAFANARFVLLPDCGHLPQIERPDALLTEVEAFADQTARPV
jgi:pimeloyl-ACP methyl ester carboxylesterase